MTRYDFTVVYHTNLIGNGFQEFLDPLLDDGGMGWSTPGDANSDLGGPFPCVDDVSTLTTMNHKARTTTLALIVSLLALGGCRNTLPCPDCDDNAGDADLPQEEEGPTPDLPCGGADLMTDNDNCGSCGNACPLWYEGTDWEAGTCSQGECGPRWSGCIAGEGVYATCGERCAAGGQACVANGCSGFTGLLTRVGFDGNCNPIPPDGTMTGSCDDAIPWETTVEWSLEVLCCCE